MPGVSLAKFVEWAFVGFSFGFGFCLASALLGLPARLRRS
jgi:hypothetical protein